MKVNMKELIAKILQKIDELAQTLKRTTGENSTTLSLGTLYTAGLLTQASGRLYFTIPTGRVFPDGTTVTKVTGEIAVRAGSSNGTGIYIVKSTSGGTSPKDFDTTSAFSFYNGNNASVSIPAANITVSLQGNTNVNIFFDGDPSATKTYRFAGTSTINGYINNHPMIVQLTTVQVTLQFPT